MEAVRTSETSVDNNFTRQYIAEDNSEHLLIVLNVTMDRHTNSKFITLNFLFNEKKVKFVRAKYLEILLIFFQKIVLLW
jgi:hypothetical protein